MLVELYRINIRSKRFYLRIIFHLIDVCVVNAWLLYRRHCSLQKEKNKTLIQFRTEIAHALLKAGKSMSKKRGRPSRKNSKENSPQSFKKRRILGPRPINDVRYDGIGHWPEHSDNKQRCKLCIKAYSRMKCKKCEIYLCLNKNNNCFFNFHVKHQGNTK